MATNLNFEQVVNQPFLYVYGFQISNPTATTLAITSGQCRDSTGQFDIPVTDASTTLDATKVGLNGLDTGTFQASKIYYIHAIYDNTNRNPSGFILSLSKTNPVLPLNYNSFRMIGIWPSDIGAHFMPGSTLGSGVTRTFNYHSPFNVLDGGTVTVDTNIDLSLCVPPIADTPVYFSGVAVSTVAGNEILIKYGSTTLITWSAPVISVNSWHTFKVPAQLASNSPVITYLTGTGVEGFIWVLAFDYAL